MSLPRKGFVSSGVAVVVNGLFCWPASHCSQRVQIPGNRNKIFRFSSALQAAT